YPQRNRDALDARALACEEACTRAKCRAFTLYSTTTCRGFSLRATHASLTYGLSLRHAATDARRNASRRALALAVVPQRPLSTQGTDGPRPTYHQVGWRCFKRPSPAIGTVQALRQQGRRPSASERAV